MSRTCLPHRFVQAVNRGPRRDGKVPDILLLHYTGMETAEKACDWLCCEESGVSCHYLIDEAGNVVQMVDEDERAWHAGQSFWNGERDINSLSIGIEIQNAGVEAGDPPFPDAQMEAVIALSRDIVARHEIRPERVLAHSDVAPGRKVDPGANFDWGRLHAAGIGHWIEPQPGRKRRGGRDSMLSEGDEGFPVEALQAMLGIYGYEVELNGKYDAVLSVVVRAFQLHFRQSKVDGIADHSTLATLHALIGSLPA